MKPYYIFPLLFCPAILASAQDSSLRTAFDRRYADYFEASSQTALPFPRMEKQEWKTLLESKPLQLVFSEPGRYYIGKTYTLKLFHDGSANGYYLDAIGGFWGMEELVFGPLTEQALK